MIASTHVRKVRIEMGLLLSSPNKTMMETKSRWVIMKGGIVRAITKDRRHHGFAQRLHCNVTQKALFQGHLLSHCLFHLGLTPPSLLILVAKDIVSKRIWCTPSHFSLKTPPCLSLCAAQHTCARCNVCSSRRAENPWGICIAEADWHGQRVKEQIAEPHVWYTTICAKKKKQQLGSAQSVFERLWSSWPWAEEKGDWVPEWRMSYVFTSCFLSFFEYFNTHMHALFNI